ncbi:phage major capsid protein [Clostridium butyricum]|uniref:phage major capsid protein n=1 Tax=Clostridium butyricum TaxID=1492 RepID=UPI002AB0C88C|nr:phage major capsid protein [Clostridium butyricum]
MNEKAYMEKRNTLLTELEGLTTKATGEKRNFNEDERKRVAEIKKEVKGIDEILATIKETRAFGEKTEEEKRKEEQRKEEEERDKKGESPEERAAKDKAVFADFIRGKRALDVANNGAVIPETISSQIIETVKELTPLLNKATVFNTKGTLKFPVYDDTNLAAAYVEDMEELTETSGKFTSVSLENYIVGILTKVSRSLVNNSDIDVANFAITKLSEKLSEFLNKELLIGKTKIHGITNVSGDNAIITSTAGIIKADDLIDTQLIVPQIYQGGCEWLMNKSDFASIRKLKNTNGDYILTPNYAAGFGYLLLGKNVNIDENADAVYYGDYSGLYVKFSQNMEVQVLNEKYATQHATGVVGYFEGDANIIEKQKISKLTKKSGS